MAFFLVIRGTVTGREAGGVEGICREDVERERNETSRINLSKRKEGNETTSIFISLICEMFPVL